MKHGFSLVELSIVLVILGLLTGGILGGQSLMRAAELRSVAQEYSTYQTALNTFKDKYFALPGDMNNAVDFWGAADGGDGENSDCWTVASTDQTTCNGNGDGLIQINSTTQLAEGYRFWQHLANAGLIEGSYTGYATQTMTGSNQRYGALGVNLPASKLSNGGWYAVRNETTVNDYTSALWPGYYTMRYFYGAIEPNDLTAGPLMKPEEAWNIDAKIDDGRPAFGKLLSHRAKVNCTTNQNDSDTAEYLLSESGKTCALIFIGR